MLRNKFTTTRKLDATSFAIFMWGASGSLARTKKYNFATDGLIDGANLTRTVAIGGTAALGPADYGIFTTSFYTDKYVFATNAVTPYSNVLNQNGGTSCAIGSDIKGLLVRGTQSTAYNGTPFTTTIDYASTTVVAGTDLKGPSIGGTAMGQLDHAVVILGCINQPGHVATNVDINRYVYASNVVQTEPAFPVSFSFGSSTSTATFGLVAWSDGVGTARLATYKYNFATGSSSLSTNLVANNYASIGAGNDDLAFFATGATNSSRYKYADDTVQSTTTTAAQLLHQSAVSNGVTGVNR